MTTALTPDRLLADIAERLYLEPDALDPDLDLVDAGLDSLAMVRLVERWRAAGAEVSFVDLAREPTPRRWCAVVRASLPSAGSEVDGD